VLTVASRNTLSRLPPRSVIRHEGADDGTARRGRRRAARALACRISAPGERRWSGGHGAGRGTGAGGRGGRRAGAAPVVDHGPGRDAGGGPGASHSERRQWSGGEGGDGTALRRPGAGRGAGGLQGRLRLGPGGPGRLRREHPRRGVRLAAAGRAGRRAERHGGRQGDRLHPGRQVHLRDVPHTLPAGDVRGPRARRQRRLRRLGPRPLATPTPSVRPRRRSRPSPTTTTSSTSTRSCATRWACR
jgi:hypothetical protein